MKLTNRQAKTLRRWLTLFGNTKPTRFRYLRMFRGFKLQAIWQDQQQVKSQFELQMPFAPVEELEDCAIYSFDELCGEEEAPEPLEPAFIDLDERIKEKEKE